MQGHAVIRPGWPDDISGSGSVSRLSAALGDHQEFQGHRAEVMKALMTMCAAPEIHLGNARKSEALLDVQQRGELDAVHAVGAGLLSGDALDVVVAHFLAPFVAAARAACA